MGSVKWLMFNLHVWSSMSDLVMSFIGIPYILLPAPAGYGLGLVDAPRLMVYFMVTLLAAIAASIVALYENRFFILFAQKSRWSSIRKPFLLFIFTIVPLVFLPPFFNPPDQETSLQIVLSQLPCQSPVTYKNRKIYVLSLDLILLLVCIATGTTIHAISSITFGTLIFINLVTLRNRIQSEKAMEVHRKFAHALTIQSAFLLSVVLAPVLALLWIMATHHHDQALNNFVFITLSLHGAGSTIMMIFVHKPYRDFTFSKICCCFGKWKQLGDEIKRSSHVSVII
ncbi:Protein CBG26965 [Caenorhabditis briggsae]|uniref:Protein CBG26965 n=1 Tax=Caenorhabditis briggsae TaxID=6238 RepID=B6IET1_CAEBR|nr:Protein CBG26965 [Caenorhabditis briggsae]CAR98411.1 Protein CBG26965 [Caenorhabditis briggsae]